MAASRNFELLACRLSFVPSSPLRFPAAASNTFRGALGFVLQEEIFRPRLSAGPSGLVDPPRPFVLQADWLDGRIVEGRFELGLNLFDPRLEPVFRQAFQYVAENGVTARRVRLDLERWASQRVDIDLGAAPAAGRARVRFETPTELKGWDGEGLPPFGVLARRLRDRLSALREMYGAGPLEIDFRGFGVRADLVAAVDGRLERSEGERRSARTGMVHPLCGLTGWIEYEGDLGEFIPYLRAGAYMGVGRQTVWGRGKLGLEVLG